MTTPAAPISATRRRLACERGASPVSTLILLIVVMMFIDLTVMGARLAQTHHDVTSGIREGARQGTLAQDAVSAAERAQHVTDRNIDDMPCAYGGSTWIDVSNFDEGGFVGVRGICYVKLSDLSFLPIPYPNHRVEVDVVEVVDTYRAIG